MIVLLRRRKKRHGKALSAARSTVEQMPVAPELMAAAAEKQLSSPTVKVDALLGEVKSSLRNDPVMCAQVLRVWLQEERT